MTKNVRRVIVHRQYDAATFANDIALLELDSPVAFDEHIVPICMPKDKEDFRGRVATVTGWGRLKYGKPHFLKKGGGEGDRLQGDSQHPANWRV